MTFSVIFETLSLADRGTVDLGEVRADLPGGQAPGGQRQHDRVDIGQAALALPDDHWLEAALPVPRHLDLDWAGVVGHHPDPSR
ncbi:hypothetical protein GCM10012283_18820 [Phycicoccus endophyticus]|nr:hypothetical protein GCM10012283_18820 [Phycicoccus endophyticus]